MSAYNLKEHKKQLRADLLARRRALSPQEKAQMDQCIVSAITSLVSYRYAEILLLFYPRPDEIDTRPLFAAAIAAGKKVAFPRCLADGKMDFFFVESENDLVAGTYGIPEPSADRPRFDPDGGTKSVLMAVPGLAFDSNGYRLGYGKGYYDRYLEHRDITTAGLVYAEFVLPSLPKGRYDLPVHFIVTEKGVTLVE